MTVSLTGGIGVRPFHRIGAWRNDHRNAGAMLGDGVIGRFAVIGAIGCELPDRGVDPLKQRLHLRDVTGILVSGPGR